MANQEHLDILKQGVDVWNKWRKEHTDIIPDLREANLSGANLSGANLSEVSFKGANLGGANLTNANLRSAYFLDANLWFANLTNANLRRADLSGVFLSGDDLSGANLRGANLSTAYLKLANLSEADLSDAYLWQANLSGADLSGADLTEARVGWTVLGNVDLRGVKGLETVKHVGPSTIDIDTIINSQGKIPESFLRRAGIPPSIIEQIPSLVGSLKPIDFYSCFISYSSKDQDFAERLYNDLQGKGVRCWFAPEDLKIGSRIRPSIDESIRLHDKLLLVLSQYSVASQWVEQEVERALARERKESKVILFPIRLDKTVMDTEEGWPALIRNTRNIGDFTRWRNHDDYKKALSRLLRGLKAEAQKMGSRYATTNGD